MCIRDRGHALVGDEHEGTLNLVAAVLDGVLAALHTLHSNHGNGVAHSGQGSVADGQRIGLHSADDSADVYKRQGLDVDLGTESGTDKGAITGKVRLRYDAGGGSWQGGQYGDMFQASVGEAKLKQVSPAGTFFVSDTLLGKPFATEEKDLRLNFPDAEIKEAYRNGQPAVLKIVINGISETLFLVKKNGGYAATKTLPSLCLLYTSWPCRRMLSVRRQLDV